jgi:PAS domain S-box-containing protein
LLLLATTGEASERQVLLLQSLDPGNVTLDYFTGNLRVDIDARAGESITFTQVVVNPSGFVTNPDEAVIGYLQTAYANRREPDLIVAMAGPAAAFAKRHRKRVFPDSPLLIAGADERFLKGIRLGANEAAVAVANDYTFIVEDILQLFPDTSTLFLVTGSGNLGRFWRAVLERDLERFRGRLTFRWSVQMSYGELLRQLSQLPPHSAILHLNFGTDGQDGAYSESRVFADIRGVANAPLFGTQTPQLGHGIVGGRLMSIDELSQATAEAALRILDGVHPRDLPVTIQQPGVPTFDWRQLQRWGVSNARLPPGSVLRFQQPSVWQRYRWGIIAGATAIIAQGLLIAGLLVNRTRRRRAEQSVRESEGRFRVLANSAPVMIRMAGPDMGSTEFNTPWLAFTGRTVAEESGKGWMVNVHHDDLARCVQVYEQAVESREPVRMEYRLRRFDGEYRWLLESWQPRITPDGSLAGFIGSAIDTTDLRAARAALSNLNRRLMEAQEQERRRLARELHDDVSQRMTLLGIELDQLRDTLPADALDARGTVEALNEAISTLGKDIQAISHRLHSSKLDLLGLAAAVGGLCREMSGQRGVTIEYVHENVPSQLPEGVAINVFRILQEAVANILKHADASSCRVVLRGVDQQLRLEVVDDGRGFEINEAVKGRGLGLLSMQERMRLIGGDVTIESEPGVGTRICVSVPLQIMTFSMA